ncbi:MAG: oligosaccharide flippase family protein [Syntrophotaleaceae bacterium]
MMDFAVLKDKLLKGSLAGLLRVVLAIPLYLVLTPYALSRLGTAMFGIWSFNTVIISLVNLTDFGFKNSLVRQVAANIDDEGEIRRYFAATFWIYLVLAIIFLIAIFMFASDLVTDVLRVPSDLHDEAVFVFVVSAASFALRFIAAPFQALIEGHQEHFYSQMISLVWLLINSAGSIVALALQPDVYSLGAVSIASNLLVFFLFSRRALQRFPFVLKRLTFIDVAAVKSLLSFGIGIHLATLVITLREPIYKIMISRFCDLESLASFEVSYRLCTQLVSVVVSPLLGTFAASALLERRPEELGKILRVMIGFNCAIFFPAILLVGSFSPSLISLWLGREANTTAFMTFVMFTAFAFYYMTQPLYKALEGTGMSGYSALVQGVGMMVSASILVGFSDKGDMAIPLSLFSGFVVVSISNFLVFRRRFRKISLIAPGKLLLLLIPVALYVSISLGVSDKWLPLLFVGYFIVHIVLLAKTRVFDFYGLAFKFLNLRQKKVSQPETGMRTS